MEFQTVITEIWTDAAPRVFGITGKLTEAQFQILYDAVGKCYDSPQIDRVAIMTGLISRESIGDDTFYNQQIDHILESHRMINLDDTNWPQYPVNTFTYIFG